MNIHFVQLFNWSGVLKQNTNKRKINLQRLGFRILVHLGWQNCRMVKYRYDNV